MEQLKRSQLFVDRSVQSALLLRAALYWAFCIIILTMIMVCWRIVTGPSRPLYVHLDYLWFHYKPAIVASIFLMPIFVLDMLRVSNRIAGPMMRLRGAMRRLADGEKNIAPIKFRKADYWQDFADEFNRLLARADESAAQTESPKENRGGHPDSESTAQPTEKESPAEIAANELVAPGVE